MNIISLPVSRWQDYKALRLKAISETPNVFENTFEEESAYPNTVWQQRLKNAQEGKGYLVFAEDKGALHGMVAALIDEGERVHHRARIVSLYVIPEERTHIELFKKLLAGLLDKLEHDPRIMHIQVTVNSQGHEAIKLYESLGFKKVGLLEKYVKRDNGFQDRYLMVKILGK